MKADLEPAVAFASVEENEVENWRMGLLKSNPYDNTKAESFMNRISNPRFPLSRKLAPAQSDLIGLDLAEVRTRDRARQLELAHRASSRSAVSN
jgi:hypothetical protein